MLASLPAGDSRFATPILFRLLPGPSRQRIASPYGYRLTYRNPESAAPGCVMTWEVSGGRLLYQIALERDPAGNLRLHCTCADAIFRGEVEGRFCKHLLGLLELGRPANEARERSPQPTDLGV